MRSSPVSPVSSVRNGLSQRALGSLESTERTVPFTFASFHSVPDPLDSPCAVAMGCYLEWSFRGANLRFKKSSIQCVFRREMERGVVVDRRTALSDGWHMNAHWQSSNRDPTSIVVTNLFSAREILRCSCLANGSVSEWTLLQTTSSCCHFQIHCFPSLLVAWSVRHVLKNRFTRGKLDLDVHST